MNFHMERRVYNKNKLNIFTPF